MSRPMTIIHNYVIQTEAHFSTYYYVVTLTLTSRLLLLDALIFCRNVSQASWLITAVRRNVLVQTGTGAKNIKVVFKASCLVIGNRPVTAGIKFCTLDCPNTVLMLVCKVGEWAFLALMRLVGRERGVSVGVSCFYT